MLLTRTSKNGESFAEQQPHHFWKPVMASVLGFNERRIMEPKLPYELRMKIWNYKDNGYKNKDIVDLVEDGAEPYVSSRKQLVRCVGSIVAKHTLGQKPRRTTIEKN